MNTTPSSTPRISSTTTSDGIAVTRTLRHGNWPMPEQVDATRQAGNSDKRALVLAGGGAAGNAWELGLIAGLYWVSAWRFSVETYSSKVPKTSWHGAVTRAYRPGMSAACASRQNRSRTSWPPSSTIPVGDG